MQTPYFLTNSIILPQLLLCGLFLYSTRGVPPTHAFFWGLLQGDHEEKQVCFQ